jgi:hypothetical protein
LYKTLITKDARQRQFELGTGNDYGRVPSLDGIPNAGQHIGNWICHHVFVSSSRQSTAYQLALVTPGNIPLSANSRKQIRHSLNRRM